MPVPETVDLRTVPGRREDSGRRPASAGALHRPSDEHALGSVHHETPVVRFARATAERRGTAREPPKTDVDAAAEEVGVVAQGGEHIGGGNRPSLHLKAEHGRMYVVYRAGNEPRKLGADEGLQPVQPIAKALRLGPVVCDHRRPGKGDVTLHRTAHAVPGYRWPSSWPIGAGSRSRSGGTGQDDRCAGTAESARRAE
jgi:hypothetical protein